MWHIYNDEAPKGKDALYNVYSGKTKCYNKFSKSKFELNEILGRSFKGCFSGAFPKQLLSTALYIALKDFFPTT